MSGPLKLPWQPLDAHGDGILARIVHDAEFSHVGVFDTAEQARAVCETMNRAPGVEAERSELAAEVARLREALEHSSADKEALDEARAAGWHAHGEVLKRLESERAARAETREQLAEEEAAHIETRRQWAAAYNKHSLCTPAERKVLEACADLIIFEPLARPPAVSGLHAVCEAELAKRGKKP